MRRPIATTAVALGLVILLVAAGIVGVHVIEAGRANSGPECTVPGDPADPSIGVVNVTAVQLQHASTINAVGMARGVPERARVIALATAFQESGLRNLDRGDRDSVGLFQQRPSQGWGTVAQIMDPVYAAGKFYDALLQISGWQQMPLAAAAQAVQYSGFPDAYAKWEPAARTLARALGGTVEVALSCRAGAAASTAAVPARPATPGAAGADPGMAAILAAARAEFGALAVAAVSAGGRTAAASVALPAQPPAVAGRALAAWAVAHATGMNITAVQLGTRRWAGHRWADVAAAAGAPAPDEVSLTVGG